MKDKDLKSIEVSPENFSTRTMDLTQIGSDISTANEIRPPFAVHPEGSFARELSELINYHSMENVSNTQDFILAEYLLRCLDTFNTCVNKRDTLSDK